MQTAQVIGSSGRCRPRSIAIALGLFMALESSAAPENITRGEIALLPEYCPVSQTFGIESTSTNPDPRQRPWIEQMGKAFWAIHHYCWAMITAHRARQPGLPREHRAFMYQSAINDSLYVLNHSQPGFVLLPEILFRMGEYAIGANDPGRAIEFFERSINENTSYWPAHLALGRLQAKLGRRQEAITVIQNGLNAVPGQADLLRALEEVKATSSAPRPASKSPR